MDNFNVYKDIQARTKGEIYIGVVGPVRTGKSTFIKRFMELAVLPAMEDEFMVFPASAALQLLAYYVSMDKGLDVDKPRNLAKVVTVE